MGKNIKNFSINNNTLKTSYYTDMPSINTLMKLRAVYKNM